MKLSYRILGLISIAVLAGCNSEDAATAKKVDAAKNRAKPGYARLVNLSADSIIVKWNTNQVLMQVAGETWSNYRPLKAGEQKLILEIDKQGTIEIPIMTESDRGTTVIYRGKGQYGTFDGDVRYPADENTRVIFLGADLKPVTSGAAEIGGTGGKMKLDASKPSINLPIGTAEPDMGETNVEAAYAYTIVNIAEGNGFKTILLVNSPTDKPGATGAAG
jgi:hypothetical protein